jgi:hypothetical protein
MIVLDDTNVLPALMRTAPETAVNTQSHYQRPSFAQASTADILL